MIPLCQRSGQESQLPPTRASTTGPKVPPLPSAISQLQEVGKTKEEAEKEDIDGKVSSLCARKSYIQSLGHSPIHLVFSVSICSALCYPCFDGLVQSLMPPFTYSFSHPCLHGWLSVSLNVSLPPDTLRPFWQQLQTHTSQISWISQEI